MKSRELLNGIRGYWTRVDNGRITITDYSQPAGIKRKTIITVQESCIATQRCIENGKTVYFLEHGKVEKKKGEYLLRFRRGTTKAYDGLSTRYDQVVFGYPGVCKTFYKHGRLIWQKFYHKNKKLCYHFSPWKPQLTMKYPDGKLLYEFIGKLDFRRKVQGMLVWLDIWNQLSSTPDWSVDGNCTFARYDIVGRLIEKGEYRNKQRIGEWVINRKEVLFINGLTVPKKMYETPPEKMDPIKILKIKDVDIRSIMMNRIGLKRIAEEIPFEQIHKDKGMKLLRFNGSKKEPPIHILQVTCPTTKQPYFLRVPPDIDKCEDARQWTFHVDEGDNPINFDVET